MAPGFSSPDTIIVVQAILIVCFSWPYLIDYIWG